VAIAYLEWQEAASRMFTVVGIILLFLMLIDAERILGTRAPLTPFSPMGAVSLGSNYGYPKPKLWSTKRPPLLPVGLRLGPAQPAPHRLLAVVN
jgi:hypothetical protein